MEEIPKTDDELMRDFVQTSTLDNPPPREEWEAAETEDEDQIYPDGGMTDAETSFIGAAEWQEKLHPRGPGGRFSKKLAGAVSWKDAPNQTAVDMDTPAWMGGRCYEYAYNRMSELRKIGLGDHATIHSANVDMGALMNVNNKHLGVDAGPIREGVWFDGHAWIERDDGVMEDWQGNAKGMHPTFTVDQFRKVAKPRDEGTYTFEALTTKSGKFDMSKLIRYGMGDKEWNELLKEGKMLAADAEVFRSEISIDNGVPIVIVNMEPPRALRAMLEEAGIRWEIVEWSDGESTNLAEINVKGYVRRDGTVVKPYKRIFDKIAQAGVDLPDGSSSTPDAPKGKVGKLDLITDIPLGARVRYRYKGWADWSEGILQRRTKEPIAPNGTLVIGSGPTMQPLNLSMKDLEIERIDDGPVDLAKMRTEVQASLDSWSPPPPLPNIDVPQLPDEYWAKAYRDLLKEREREREPNWNREALKAFDAKFEPGGEYDWINHPESSEFIATKAKASSLNTSIATEWNREWWQKQIADVDAGLNKRVLRNRWVEQTEPIPDYVADIDPEVKAVIDRVAAKSGGMDNLDFKFDVAGIIFYGNDGGFGFEVDDDLVERMREAFKPISNRDNPSPKNWPGEWSPSIEDGKIRWKQVAPGSVLVSFLEDPVSADPDEYWYQAKRGQMGTLTVVPNKRAVEQEEKVRGFGRLVFEDMAEKLEADPDVIEAREQVSDSGQEIKDLNVQLSSMSATFVAANRAARDQIIGQRTEWWKKQTEKYGFPEVDPTPVWIRDTIMKSDIPDSEKKMLIDVLDKTSDALSRAEANSEVGPIQEKLDKAQARMDAARAKIDGAKRKVWEKTMRDLYGIKLGGSGVDLDAPDIPEMKDAQGAYPASWIERSNQAGEVFASPTPSGRSASLVNRGFYNHTEGSIWLPKSGTNSERTHVAVHELGHRMEYSVPGIVAMEAAFHYQRTSSENPVMIYGEPDEWAKRDLFVNLYSGKMYEGDSWEVFTMGMQAAHPYKSSQSDDGLWERDRDYMGLIAGLVALR